MESFGKITDILNNKDPRISQEKLISTFINEMKKSNIASIKELKDENIVDFYKAIHEELTEVKSKAKDVSDTEDKDNAEEEKKNVELDEDSKYQEFFKKKMEKFNITSISQLDEKGKEKFFTEISSEWKGDKKVSEEYNTKVLEACKKGKKKEKKVNEAEEAHIAYIHFYDKIFAHLNEAEIIEKYYNATDSMLKDLDSKDALLVFKNKRLEELK
jgi:hypothetical protein